MKKLSIFLVLFFAILSIGARSYGTNISNMEIFIKDKSIRLYYATDFQNMEFLTHDITDPEVRINQLFPYLSERIKIDNLGKECSPSLVASSYFSGTNLAYFIVDYKCASKVENLTLRYDMFFEFFGTHQAHTTFNIGDNYSRVIFRDTYRSHILTIPVSAIFGKSGVGGILTEYKYVLFFFVLFLMVGIYLRNFALIMLAFSLVIMIVALAYFGVSPSKFLPNRCTFSAEFSCTDHLLRNNEVRAKLKNNIGVPIEITEVNLTKDDGTALSCINPALGTFKSGEVREFAWILCAAPTDLIQGNKGKVLISLKYYSSSSSSTFTKESQGEIYSTVQ